jgi:hypothetical protein
MTSKTRLVTSLPAFLLIPLLALGLPACEASVTDNARAAILKPLSCR